MRSASTCEMANSSTVECHLAKVDVEGSNPFSRSRKNAGATRDVVEGPSHPVDREAVPDVRRLQANPPCLPTSRSFSTSRNGFRPGGGAHDALRSLNQALYRGEVNWILEADIVSFFDNIDREMLMEMLRERVADGSLLRLVGKCLHVVVLDGAEYSEPDEGSGAGLEPLAATWQCLPSPRARPLVRARRPSADASHRHLPVKKQHAALVRRINGHCNDFGVNGNSRSLIALLFYVRRAWHKWLSRRSQRAYLTWRRFLDLLRDFPLPRPSIRVQIWATP